MLSKRAKYAIKTLIYLYKNEGNSPVSAKSISENENINSTSKQLLEKVDELKELIA